MILALRWTAWLLLCTVTLSGCSSLTGKTAGQSVDDATTTAAVKSQLAQERVATLTRIDVDTDRGTVYLTGTVNSPRCGTGPARWHAA